MVNRLGARFGQDLHTVIFAPRQFSAWNAGDPNRRLAQDPERYATDGADRETWEIAQQVALQVLQGQSVDPTNGALFYHARSVHPAWSAYGVGRLEIGSHVFYHDVLCACRARWRRDDPSMAAANPNTFEPPPALAQPQTPTPLPPDTLDQIGAAALSPSQSSRRFWSRLERQYVFFLESHENETARFAFQAAAPRNSRQSCALVRRVYPTTSCNVNKYERPRSFLPGHTLNRDWISLFLLAQVLLQNPASGRITVPWISQRNSASAITAPKCPEVLPPSERAASKNHLLSRVDLDSRSSRRTTCREPSSPTFGV
jgi:hypothetical protein